MNVARRRVVITGIGLVSPLGSTKDALWDGLSSGRSAVALLCSLPPADLPVRFAAGARQFQGDIEDFGPLEKEQKKAIRKGLKVMCRECQMGVAAAQLALHDAGLGLGQTDPERAGIAFGTDYMLTVPEEFTEGIRHCLDGDGRFDFSRWATEGMPKMSPLWLLKYLPNMPASHLAIYNDFRGPNNSLTMREAAANAAVGDAYQTIVRGSAEVMLAGATGTRLHPLKMMHAMQQEQLADGQGDPARASRPFDRDRTGMVLGEGAGAILLEELAAAQRRGATIYGELLASASASAARPMKPQKTNAQSATSVSSVEPTIPSPVSQEKTGGAADIAFCGINQLVARRDQAMTNVLRALLRASAVGTADVGHLNAHGLSTRNGDAEEARAIRDVFASRAKPLPVVAAKSYFGNLGAASGMIELIASLMALQHGRLFPILNYETPDPECPVAAVTDGETPAGDSFVNLNVTPQGQASAVLVRRFG